MKVIVKIASSLDGAISLVLGGDTKQPRDFCIDQYRFYNKF